MRQYFVYLMASRSRTLYVGVTNDLVRRVDQHKSGLVPGFTSRYRIDRLVYTESTPDVRAALAREKQIKAWSRAKKSALIEAANPAWEDLAGRAIGSPCVRDALDWSPVDSTDGGGQ